MGKGITLEYIQQLKNNMNTFIDEHGFTRYDELLEMSQELDRVLNEYDQNQEESKGRKEGVA